MREFLSGSCITLGTSRTGRKLSRYGPVLCDDRVAENLLLGGAILALLRQRRLVLLLLEFATHFV